MTHPATWSAGCFTDAFRSGNFHEMFHGDPGTMPVRRRLRVSSLISRVHSLGRAAARRPRRRRAARRHPRTCRGQGDRRDRDRGRRRLGRSALRVGTARPPAPDRSLPRPTPGRPATGWSPPSNARHLVNRGPSQRFRAGGDDAQLCTGAIPPGSARSKTPAVTRSPPPRWKPVVRPFATSTCSTQALPGGSGGGVDGGDSRRSGPAAPDRTRGSCPPTAVHDHRDRPDRGPAGLAYELALSG